MNKNRHEIINNVARQINAQTYLEIGIGNGFVFSNIRIPRKMAVDPNLVSTIRDPFFRMGSDDFFNEFPKALKSLGFKSSDENNKTVFDLIFIDGLHHADQVERDIINSWKWLNVGGRLLIHDVAPFNEEMTIVPRVQEQWTGDVFRATSGFIKKYSKKLPMNFHREKYGILEITKTADVPEIESGFTMKIKFSSFKQTHLPKLVALSK